MLTVTVAIGKIPVDIQLISNQPHLQALTQSLLRVLIVECMSPSSFQLVVDEFSLFTPDQLTKLPLLTFAWQVLWLFWVIFQSVIWFIQLLLIFVFVFPFHSLWTSNHTPASPVLFLIVHNVNCMPLKPQNVYWEVGNFDTGTYVWGSLYSSM